MTTTANVLYAHLADNVFVSEGGKLNLIGVFAGLNNPGSVGVNEFPAVYPRFALAVGLATTKEKLPIEITFRTEDGKNLAPPFSGTFEIQRQPGQAKTEAANINFNLNFDTIRIEQSGKLYLTIESGKEELAELEINAVKVDPPQTPPQTPPSV